MSYSGILLIDKPVGPTSFNLIALLRKRLHIQKIGHTGTLDPFASGVMVLLVGREYTRTSAHFLGHDKEYRALVRLGIATDTYDREGKTLSTSSREPSLEELQAALSHFQGWIDQIPPMFSAKKIGGKKLYHLARKGIEIERAPQRVHLQTELLSYSYPWVDIHVTSSKGTYIRSIAHDLGELLGTGACLEELRRTRSGSFPLAACHPFSLLATSDFPERFPSLALRHPPSVPNPTYPPIL